MLIKVSRYGTGTCGEPKKAPRTRICAMDSPNEDDQRRLSSSRGGGGPVERFYSPKEQGCHGGRFLSWRFGALLFGAVQSSSHAST